MAFFGYYEIMSASSSNSSSYLARFQADCSASISWSSLIPVVGVIWANRSSNTACWDACVISLAMVRRLATRIGSHCSGESLLAAIPAIDCACQICDVTDLGPGSDFRSRGLLVSSRREMIWYAALATSAIGVV